MKIKLTEKENNVIEEAIGEINNIEPIDNYSLRLIRKSGKNTYEIDENVVVGLIGYYTFTLQKTGRPIKEILNAIPSIQGKFEEFMSSL